MKHQFSFPSFSFCPKSCLDSNNSVGGISARKVFSEKAKDFFHQVRSFEQHSSWHLENSHQNTSRNISTQHRKENLMASFKRSPAQYAVPTGIKQFLDNQGKSVLSFFLEKSRQQKHFRKTCSFFFLKKIFLRPNFQFWKNQSKTFDQTAINELIQNFFHRSFLKKFQLKLWQSLSGTVVSGTHSQ